MESSSNVQGVTPPVQAEKGAEKASTPQPLVDISTSIHSTGGHVTRRFIDEGQSVYCALEVMVRMRAGTSKLSILKLIFVAGSAIS